MGTFATSSKPPKRSHQWIDARSLAMCRLIAEKIRREPALFDIARRNLERWKRTQLPWPHALAEWEKILNGNSVERVMKILTEDSEEGARLRQSDPFCGILSEEERLQFLLHYEEA